MCGLEFPDIESKIWSHYRDRGVLVVGVSGGGLFGNESRDTVEAFVEQTKVTFPIVLGDESRRGYGDPAGRISPFPFDVLLDREGKIRYLGTKFDSAHLRAVIDEVLAESGAPR